ncbi:hypothetical protein CAPTEDRAFT_202140 [Capitella teleta]|uniref:Uncharacterized protein n=1 Tax=Capitella teleta TaxID=283909 RepID=R7U3N1_CAPTE|nr:hypothetical protein CAPTEDRAFT_202140 [Capitella teleta]|eukprot:ELU00746.1 hypothetical protein CAPTEDRAFT_202140 [Capitella teleta]
MSKLGCGRAKIQDLKCPVEAALSRVFVYWFAVFSCLFVIIESDDFDSLSPYLENEPSQLNPKSRSPEEHTWRKVLGAMEAEHRIMDSSLLDSFSTLQSKIKAALLLFTCDILILFLIVIAQVMLRPTTQLKDFITSIGCHQGVLLMTTIRFCEEMSASFKITVEDPQKKFNHRINPELKDILEYIAGAVLLKLKRRHN